MADFECMPSALPAQVIAACELLRPLVARMVRAHADTIDLVESQEAPAMVLAMILGDAQRAEDTHAELMRYLMLTKHP